MLHLASPHLVVDVAATQHMVLAPGQNQQDLKLAHGQADPATVHQGLDLVGANLIAVHQREAVSMLLGLMQSVSPLI